jgi:LysM repeat protein
MRFTFIAFIIMLTLPIAIHGQVPVELSSEKIVSGGKTYYMHRIVKGQTLYSISRAYNVTIDEIVNENNIKSGAIYPDQIIRIPAYETKYTIVNDTRGRDKSQGQSQVQTPPQTQTKPLIQSQPQSQSPPVIEISDQKIVSGGKVYYVHEIKKGETLWSISKAYGVPLEIIYSDNEFSRSGIMAGQVLKIPAPETESPGQGQDKPKPSSTSADSAKEGPPPSQSIPLTEIKEPEPKSQLQAEPEPQVQAETESVTVSNPAAKKPVQPEKKVHKVQKGESLSDIAKKYNITVSELKQANKGLIFPTAGMRLVIPVKTDDETKP